MWGAQGVVLGRWVLLRGAGLPATWLVWLGFAGLIPLLSRLTPFRAGLLETEAAARLAREWALPAAELGAAFGLIALSRVGPLLLQLPNGVRWIGEASGVLAPVLALQAALLAGALLAGSPPAELIPLAAPVLALDLHVAALALLVLAAPLASSARLLVFFGIVWLLPALAADGGRALELVHSWSDASHHLRDMQPFGPPLGAAWASFGPPAGLLLASWLLRVPLARSKGSTARFLPA